MCDTMYHIVFSKKSLNFTCSSLTLPFGFLISTAINFPSVNLTPNTSGKPFGSSLIVLPPTRTVPALARQTLQPFALSVSIICFEFRFLSRCHSHRKSSIVVCCFSSSFLNSLCVSSLLVLLLSHTS